VRVWEIDGMYGFCLWSVCLFPRKIKKDKRVKKCLARVREGSILYYDVRCHNFISKLFYEVANSHLICFFKKLIKINSIIN
jgi:hypothetical protein